MAKDFTGFAARFFGVSTTDGILFMSPFVLAFDFSGIILKARNPKTLYRKGQRQLISHYTEWNSEFDRNSRNFAYATDNYQEL